MAILVRFRRLQQTDSVVVYAYQSGGGDTVGTGRRVTFDLDQPRNPNLWRLTHPDDEANAARVLAAISRRQRETGDPSWPASGAYMA